MAESDEKYYSAVLNEAEFSLYQLGWKDGKRWQLRQCLAAINAAGALGMDVACCDMIEEWIQGKDANGNAKA